MRKTPVSLQDLRRSLYVKAKAEPTWRFRGLYVHICKMETLREAYQMAKENDGAPGIDGRSFEDIEESGREEFLKQIQEELVQQTLRRDNPNSGSSRANFRSRSASASLCGLGGYHPSGETAEQLKLLQLRSFPVIACSELPELG